MPVELLSKSARAKLSRFPEKIPREDLRRHFTLSEEDREAAGQLCGGANPLGFALALSVLRYLGFFPPDLTDAPEEAACYVADQIGARPDVLEEYGTRAQTTTRGKIGGYVQNVIIGMANQPCVVLKAVFSPLCASQHGSRAAVFEKGDPFWMET